MNKFFPIAAFLLPQAALAHVGHHDEGQFLAGMAHPVGGADHMLAMVALGLLAAQGGGRALWALPLGFVGSMIAGGLAGVGGLPFPGVEPMILASVIILGALVAMAARLPLAVLLPGAALFGFAHGWAHGAEGPAAGMTLYALGFAVATMALHLAGIGIGKGLQSGVLLRVLGAAASVAGMALAMGG
ncbi:HupE/UreJ family protein [Paracoccus benzoatiresistens]|uniref:HupE/UreJ family protein n=1 Tax=Paracoccus benzoatiresistens TaxID=2997341 RepID=A0ABT4IZ22_9RHOB|nr:HupE/UreJ family protein [Paracoccus sp. EF6]MCZ0960112.1 HupE/UreJ family protein [Paracoccus sp. EF6]